MVWRGLGAVKIVARESADYYFAGGLLQLHRDVKGLLVLTSVHCLRYYLEITTYVIV